MLKRARIFSVIALVAAIFGFSGILNASADIAQAVCYFFGGFAGLSWLFCLFEPCEDSDPARELLTRR